VALTTGGSSDSATPAPTAVPPAPRVVHRRRFLGSRRRQTVAFVVIAGAIAFLVFQGLSNATEYFLTADQAVAQRSHLGTRQFRIEGTVQPDVRQVGHLTDFSIYANGVSVPVTDSADPSQLFKPGIPVVLEGHWSGTVFSSDLIMVKHSASYTEAHPDRLKSQLPTSTPGASSATPGASSATPGAPSAVTP
jgi:cytochrome c-type biogenesis protein CcmE